MQLVSLDQLVADAKLFCDQRSGSNASFLSATEWANLVNKRCKKHYDMCIMANPEFYAIELVATLDTGELTSLPGAVVIGKRLFAQMPTSPPYYMLKGIEVMWADDDIEIVLPPPDGSASTAHYERLTWSRYNTKCYVIGGSPTGSGEGFWLAPGPPALDGTRLRIRYIPAFEPLGAPNSKGQANNDFNAVNGWDQLVALGAAMDANAIQGKANDDLMPLYNEEFERLERMSRERNAQEKKRVRDVQPEGMDGLYGRWGIEGYVVGPK